MASSLVERTVVSVGAGLLIADGVMGLLGSVVPRWHSLLWHVGPELAKAATEELESRRNPARLVYVAEAAIGVALIAMLESDDDE